MLEITPDDADIGERSLAEREADQEIQDIERDTKLNNLDSFYAHLHKAIVSLPIEEQKDMLETVQSIVKLEIDLESYNNA